MSSPTPARLAAYETLRRVFEDGAWADRALRSAVSRPGLGGRERAQAQALAYGAVQRRGSSDHFIELLAGRRPEKIDPPLLAALRLGLYELLWADGADHAAVDQAVALAKGPRGNRRGSGLVNALLRRAIRERKELLAGLSDADPTSAALMHSVPEWLAELWWVELGADEARSLLAAINQPPERAFRVVDGKAAELLERAPVDGRLSADGPPPAPDEIVVIEGGDWVWIEGAVTRGEIVPQSRGSASVVDILDPQPGERVLDLCAGPGIKASQIAARLGEAGAGLVAVERDAGRASELEELLKRTGATEANVICADASERPQGLDFDAVLVDPPCSGLGTLASRPDARWRRSPQGVTEMAALAEKILARALEAVKPGGRIVYSTCTISRAENEGVVDAETTAGATVVDLGAISPSLVSPNDPRFLQTRPDRDGTDGFFVASLRATTIAR